MSGAIGAQLPYITPGGTMQAVAAVGNFYVKAPSLQHNKGQTVLHILADCSLGGELIKPKLVDMFVAYGTQVNHANIDSTALHIMARNLRLVNAVRALLSQGEDINCINMKENTPLHEAMEGNLLSRQTREGELERVTLADRISA
ncbi:uncharacterized protein TRUGW13939_10836 [Talaromyces rugulosus]|uniref:Uncharacterized protein n=1 Tax=Talaromyces rugulosus TaxID=121627 RepID=A0A7H8RDS1_TALRU|nr:uncharacterized protein TRUGW13939_10836 [Talaromyces rugulosus]QKX63665.1 hypothetical protein TRUGW13939_10836 [Talaromyces rugulosus]